MASPKITLYVDTVSPFAYEAYWLLRVSFLTGDPGFECAFGLNMELKLIRW